MIITPERINTLYNKCPWTDALAGRAGRTLRAQHRLARRTQGGMGVAQQVQG